MQTTSSRDLDIENVRARARRLRLPVDTLPQPDRTTPCARWHRFDRFRIGMLIALIVDVIAVAVLIASPEMPFMLVFLLGPLTVLFAYPQWATITLVSLVVAGVAGQWRFAGGLFLFQAGWVLLGVAWLLLFGNAGSMFSF